MARWRAGVLGWPMVKIRRDDHVQVMTGKDRGKSGKVLEVFPDRGRALVEGINLVKRHIRPTQENPKGGLATQERPVSVANVRRICPRCNRPTRVAMALAADGTKSRACARCKEIL